MHQWDLLATLVTNWVRLQWKIGDNKECLLISDKVSWRLQWKLIEISIDCPWWWCHGGNGGPLLYRSAALIFLGLFSNHHKSTTSNETHPRQTQYTKIKVIQVISPEHSVPRLMRIERSDCIEGTYFFQHCVDVSATLHWNTLKWT